MRRNYCRTSMAMRKGTSIGTTDDLKVRKEFFGRVSRAIKLPVLRWMQVPKRKE